MYSLPKSMAIGTGRDLGVGVEAEWRGGGKETRRRRRRERERREDTERKVAGMVSVECPEARLSNVRMEVSYREAVLYKEGYGWQYTGYVVVLESVVGARVCHSRDTARLSQC